MTPHQVRRSRAASVAAMLLLVLCAPPAAAAQPVVTRVTFDETFPDFFAGPLADSGCAFTVSGSWTVEVRDTLFVGSNGEPAVDELEVWFQGILFNSATGDSVPDAGHFRRRTELAADGAPTQVDVTAERDNRYLHEAFHERWVPDDSSLDHLVIAAGRDELALHHPLDTAPLCAALS